MFHFIVLSGYFSAFIVPIICHYAHLICCWHMVL